MSLQSVPASAGETLVLDVGAVLGGRFALEERCSDGTLDTVFRARDQKTDRAVAIRVLREDTSAMVEVLRERVKAAAKLRHRNIAAIYGLGTHAGTTRYVAEEWVQGTDLSAFVHEHMASGAPVPLRGAYNLVAHVCKALAALHPNEFHGALRPGVVHVSRSGRVKLSSLGLSRAIVEAGLFERLPAEDQAFLAPEVRAGNPPTPAADIFGLGALLYVMLTGRSPAEAFVLPSEVHAEATKAVDDLLMRCLSADPAARFTSAEEVTAALLPLVTAAAESDLSMDDLEVEVDVDIATSLAPQPPAARRQSSAPPPPPRASRPPKQPALAQPTAPVAPAAAQPNAAPAPQGLEHLVEQLTQNDSPKWMASKDGMDHGPFTTRELIKMIVEGEVLADHPLFHLSRNERKPLREYPEFAEFIAQYELRKAESDHHKAVERSKQVEKRSNTFKSLVLVGGLAAIALAGGLFVMSRQRGNDESAEDVDLAAAYGDGQVRIEGTSALLKDGRRGKPRKGKGAQGRSGGLGSYEDAMNQAMELGDATKSGGERWLQRSDVQAVMNKHLNSLASCPAGGYRGNVTIDLAIRGSGDVMGATVSGGGGAYKSCVIGKVKRIKFPSFPAQRMGARYSYDQ